MKRYKLEYGIDDNWRLTVGTDEGTYSDLLEVILTLRANENQPVLVKHGQHASFEIVDSVKEILRQLGFEEPDDEDDEAYSDEEIKIDGIVLPELKRSDGSPWAEG